ncbi:hypothetical protein P4S63_06220 [Pseudoalteromonas sp. B193]
MARLSKTQPNKSEWADRDRFILSNGHGSMLIYSLLHPSGYDLPLDEIKNFRQMHSKHQVTLNMAMHQESKLHGSIRSRDHKCRRYGNC